MLHNQCSSRGANASNYEVTRFEVQAGAARGSGRSGVGLTEANPESGILTKITNGVSCWDEGGLNEGRGGDACGGASGGCSLGGPANVGRGAGRGASLCTWAAPPSPPLWRVVCTHVPPLTHTSSLHAVPAMLSCPLTNHVVVLFWGDECAGAIFACRTRQKSCGDGSNAAR